MRQRLEKSWYQVRWWNYCLLPIAWLFAVFSIIRRWLYRYQFKKTVTFPVPIVIIGNITIGGTGKTPFSIWLINWLKEHGYKPGIVSRGYGGQANHIPQAVSKESDPNLVGDEAVLLAKKTACPVVVGINRAAAIQLLLNQSDCNIVVSDDGLQHLAIDRTFEIIIIDGERRLGNGFYLPAGPLRESSKKLQQVDMVINNGHFAEKDEFKMKLSPKPIYNLNVPQQYLTPAMTVGKTVHAIASIGNPERFFTSLSNLGFQFVKHAFPDHYFYQITDVNFDADAIIIMTEKCAVKCEKFNDPRFWCLPVEVELEQNGIDYLEKLFFSGRI